MSVPVNVWGKCLVDIFVATLHVHLDRIQVITEPKNCPTVRVVPPMGDLSSIPPIR